MVKAPDGVSQELWDDLHKNMHWHVDTPAAKAQTATLQQACISLYGVSNTLFEGYYSTASQSAKLWHIKNLGNNPTPIFLPTALRIGHELQWFDVNYDFTKPWSVYVGQGDNYFDDFKTAFKFLCEWLQDTMKNGGMALQILESGIWISNEEMPNLPPIFWYDAKDFACEQAWLIDGVLNIN